MAKNQKKNIERENETTLPSISFETKRKIYIIISFAFAMFLLMSAYDLAGVVGKSTYYYLKILSGYGFALLPFTSFLVGISFLRTTHRTTVRMNFVGGLIFMVATLGMLGITIGENGGGKLGLLSGFPLVRLFDIYISFVFLTVLSIAGLLIMFDGHVPFLTKEFWTSIFAKKSSEPEVTQSDDNDERNAEPAAPQTEDVKTAVDKSDRKQPKVTQAKTNDEEEVNFTTVPNASNYVPPPLDILESDRGKPGTGDIKANANIIKRTLANFGINVEMDEITIGPTVTRYALKPAEGVKLSRIVALNNDLSLALAAHPIRIEAPIPGKSLVGIEIPNSTKALVGLGTLLRSKDYQESPYPLYFALGKGTSGSTYFANIAKAPHLLIAGATGSGKSVCIHTIITSLLYRNSPDRLRLMMIDPKRVELTLYNNIPHLLTPVITDAKKAIMALKWATREMERRYNILESHAVRDIQSYHKNIDQTDDKNDPMPYIVVIIDELADIMSLYPREFEAVIVRLAQMSRAVGIHLILATQRPSVEVITGLIKANIPTRMAFQVPSQIDSRTILDSPGAEKLLGAGDMLYLGGEMSKPQRIQSAFISENEVKKVVKYLVDNYEGETSDEVSFTKTENNTAAIFGMSLNENSLDTDSGDEDDLYEEAREIVIRSGKASSSYLQRRLKVGYARAARLLDMLEERNVVGPGEGAKPRDVLIKSDDSIIENPVPENKI